MTAEIDRIPFPTDGETDGETDGNNSWQTKIQKALSLAPQFRDKAIRLVCEGLAERAAQYAYGRQERPIVQLITSIYKEIHARGKREGLLVTNEYARDVYWIVIPELLRANKVSDTFLNSEGYNSKEQIIAVAMALMRAGSTKKPIVCISQMCAQYDSGPYHASDSFARGLLQAIEPEKVARVAEPLKKIGEVLRRHEIPITYITLQLSPHPKNMLAMVPATVWSYIEQGKVAEMLQTLQRHQDIVDRLLKQGLDANGESDSYRHITRSYDEPCHHESVMDRTFRFCDVYVDAYREWVAWTARKDLYIPPTWTLLEVSHVRSFIRAMESEWLYDYVMNACERRYQEHYGRSYPKDAFKQMHTILSIEGWGTLDDTEKFYKREVSRRAASKANEWGKTIKKDEEIMNLIAHPSFHPEIIGEHERRRKAEELIDWVECIANIGIGSRAIFNTALYLSLGEELALYKEGGNIAIMWPMEEDVDRFALAAMNARYRYIINGDEGDVLPCIYPCKELRQPLK